MEDYDEDLNENPFFLTLKESCSDLFAQCVSNNWLICVPRRDSLPKYTYTVEDFFEHILKLNGTKEVRVRSRNVSTESGSSRAETDSICSSVSGKENDNTEEVLSSTVSENNDTNKSKWNYKTLSDVCVHYCSNRYVKLDETNLPRTNNNSKRGKYSVVNILFEETFYTVEKQKYKVLCIESPLYSKMIENGDSVHVEELWNVSSLRDCIDFLWMKGKLRVLESYDAYIKLFLHNHRTLDNLPLAIQKDLVYTLYLKCLNFALTYDGPIGSQNAQHTLKIATETYVCNGVYRFLMGAITSAVSCEDAYLNKIIRNLAEIHPQDLDIDQNQWDNLTRARQELGRLDIHSSPLSKLNCLKKTLRHLRPDPVMELGETQILAADELLSIWIYLIVKTHLTNWNAQLQYLKTFRFSAEDHSDNENRFYIATLEASLAHLKTGKVLGLAVGERDVGVSCELGDAWLHALNHNSQEPSDVRVAEMFSAIRLGNSTRLEELISDYEEERRQQKIEEHVVDPSLLCHPLCVCDRCTILLTPDASITVMVPAVEVTSEDGMTLLHIACIYGRPKIVDDLIARGAPLEAADSLGSSPLHYAASRGHQNALLLLLHGGANMEPLDKMSKTPLHLAAQNGHEGCVKALIYYAEHSRQTINLSARDFNGNTPLHDASRMGFQGIVQLLVENGASISSVNSRSVTPIECAHDIHIIRILHKSARRRSWVPPSHGDFINIEVIPKENLEGIVMLISEPSNCTIIDDSKNRTAVEDEEDSKLLRPPPASLRGRRHSSIIPPSLSSLNSVNELNPKTRRHSSIIPPSVGNDFTIPEDCAVNHTPEPEEDFFINSTTDREVRRISRDESSHIRKVSVESLDNIAVAILPELPAVMGVKRKRDNQSRDMLKLCTAIAAGDVPLALFYLGIPSEELGSSENQVDVLQRVPKCHPLCPCKRCQAKSAGLGLDVNLKNKEGLNALHLAIKYGLINLVKVLYRFGADLNVRSNYESKSPLQFARANNHDKIVEFLITHGATD